MTKQWRDANKEKVALYNKEYYVTNKEQIAARNKEWRNSNNERVLNLHYKRRRNIRQATLHISGLSQQIGLIYAEARRKTAETGVAYSAHHIWPINGERSCGLHVPWNLEVMTKEENDHIGNKEPEDHWNA